MEQSQVSVLGKTLIFSITYKRVENLLQGNVTCLVVGVCRDWFV